MIVSLVSFLHGTLSRYQIRSVRMCRGGTPTSWYRENEFMLSQNGHTDYTTLDSDLIGAHIQHGSASEIIILCMCS